MLLIAKMLKDTSEVNEDSFSEGNITLEEAASCYVVIVTFIERQPCYTAQEIMHLYILHSAFMSNKCQDLLKKKRKTSRLCHRVSTENPISSVYIWLSKIVLRSLLDFSFLRVL